MKNPLTWLMLAAATWILVLGVNQPWLSGTVAAAAQLWAMVRVRNLSVLLASLALALPLGLSMLLVHAPFGTQQLMPLVTVDGVALAADLTLRFVALISVFLAAATAFTVPELAKAVQGSRLLGPRLAYIVGSAVQLLPQGREALTAVREANQLRGRRTRGPVGALRNLAVPLIIRLLSTTASRATAVEVAGLDLPGRRTVLRAIPDPGWEKAARWVLPMVAIGVVVWV